MVIHARLRGLSLGKECRPHANSVILTGGGIQGGHVLGFHQQTCGLPRYRSGNSGDLAASLFHGLGRDPNTDIHDR